MYHQDCFTVKEAAKYLRISESIVRRSVKENRIPYHRIYGKILFSRAALEKHIGDITIAPITDNKEKATLIAMKLLNKIR